MNIEIKFEVFLKGKHFGYEQINAYGEWEWSCTELNPSNMIRWNKGVMTGNDLFRRRYTGLKDKNGNEIYEGDVVTYDHEDGPVIALVEWKESIDESLWISGFAFMVLSVGEYENDEPVDFVVVGNIHENPELLS